MDYYNYIDDRNIDSTLMTKQSFDFSAGKIKEYMKEHSYGLYSFLCAIFSVILLIYGHWIWSGLSALSSTFFFRSENKKSSEKIKDILLKNQKEEIRNKIKRIEIKPEKFGQFGDTISKLVIFILIISLIFIFISENEEIISRYTGKIALAQLPPYILVQNRTVHVVFEKTNGEIGEWVVPFEGLEADIKRGFYIRELMSIPMIKCKTLNGSIVEVSDYTVFVEDIWKNVIPPLYYESENDYEFIYEVWNIVTQLNTYSYDLEETPRYPLETFLAGGGDCEDTSILFASMIKSAPTNWEIALVFLDSENPFNFEKGNHLMVYINTGDEQYLIETTSKSEIQPYDELVDGCYLKI